MILTVDTVDSGAIIITRHVDGDFQGTKEIAQARKIAREVQLDTPKEVLSEWRFNYVGKKHKKLKIL